MMVHLCKPVELSGLRRLPLFDDKTFLCNTGRSAVHLKRKFAGESSCTIYVTPLGPAKPCQSGCIQLLICRVPPRI